MNITVCISLLPASVRPLLVAEAVHLELDGEGCDHENCTCHATLAVPSRKQVCGDCEGHGTVLNPSMRYHAYTAEDLQDWDDQDREEYFKRGGIYDVTCPTCNGRNVVDAIDRGAIRKGTLQHHALKAFDLMERDRMEFERACAAEARWCA